VKKPRFFPSGRRRGFIFWTASILLALALTVGTVTVQHTGSPLCQGLLGAGFPLPFVCDASGESPLSSVGKIDWADLDNINLIGSLLDILFYTFALWVIGFIVGRIFQLGRRPGP
jgi:hypothetical protein